MARKTFISYKYSEARQLRDDILDSLGEDARFYNGETASSPDLSNTTVDKIKTSLKDMIYKTTVTIVIISPQMIQSRWIEWELEYSLKSIKRGDQNSSTNGIIGVIQKVNGSYDWLTTVSKKSDGCSSTSHLTNKMFPIINNNRFNQASPSYACNDCKTFNRLSGSYISLIPEDEFLSDPSRYIENAYEKSKALTKYEIKKEA
ncbi:TIR domain-containing protein [Listeria booriae]|uniref:TIR domain-containing protein n=1 Tax=Listeria booriae TaxID=1552123 RepID=A0A7X1D4I8_9LIST|nr:TIR domain-containing protein [Listeria booriae]MBC1316251.1 TIR domain-containing protein [Listeria booriae]MBC2165770.1 TIR domain-containing protein [Listeria booriae]